MAFTVLKSRVKVNWVSSSGSISGRYLEILRSSQLQHQWINYTMATHPTFFGIPLTYGKCSAEKYSRKVSKTMLASPTAALTNLFVLLLLCLSNSNFLLSIDRRPVILDLSFENSGSRLQIEYGSLFSTKKVVLRLGHLQRLPH